MVTEYEALGTLMGTILTLSKARELRRPMRRGTNPWRRFNCKTVAIAGPNPLVASACAGHDQRHGPAGVRAPSR